MNRTSINFLCTIFLIVLAASILTPGAAFLSGVFSIFDNKTVPNAPEALNIASEDGHWPVTVLIDEPGQKIPALQYDLKDDSGQVIHTQIWNLSYMLPDKAISKTSRVLIGLCVLATIILYLVMAFKTIKFVIAINRKQVFDRRNIRRLAWIGGLLLAIALAQVVVGLIEDISVSNLNLTFDGYSLTSSWTIPWTELLLGLMALLMSQVWRRGCQLKEEQELTI